jgi:hypothetical protein
MKDDILLKCCDIIRKKYKKRWGGGFSKLSPRYSVEDIADIDGLLVHKCKKEFSASAVLGIDIYKYSKYNGFRQVLIPPLFDVLYRETVRHCSLSELFLFQNEIVFNIQGNKALVNDKKTCKSFYKNYISTGDGCYQIFSTPVHALLFAIYFQYNVNQYNAYESYPELRDYVGDLCVRYALTYGDVYRYSNGVVSSLYGNPIICNSRVLGKDKLNRFLIDDRVVEWFQRRMFGIEHVSRYNLRMLKEEVDPFDSVKYTKIPVFDDDNKGICVEFSPGKSISPSVVLWGGTAADRSMKLVVPSIKTCTALKIGNMESKGDMFHLYSLYMEVDLAFGKKDGVIMKFLPWRATLGNLNTSGLESSDYHFSGS